MSEVSIDYGIRVIQRRIAKWKTLASLSIFGRAGLVNSMIYSRFRYPAQCMLVPKEILDYIEEDVQFGIWDRDPSLDILR
eukprot:1367390-Pleurochrysis_carterae.AAC.1